MKEKQQKRAILLFLVFTSPFYAKGDASTDKKFCTDSDGKQIPHGTAFTPNFEEPCQRCICDNGYTTLCSTAACSPPPDCIDRKAIPRQCCQFECGANNSRPPSILHNTTLNDIATAEEDNITNLSLRLVASTVTSFLVLALLLFMVHRLRQRRLMMAMRRFEAQARQQRGDEEDGDHYIPAAFLHIECPPYEDPPPPYSPPKPPHILPADSPPPYEELENVDTTSDLDANANVSNNNNNNDQSCRQHGQLPPSPPGRDGQQPSSNQNACLLEAAEALNTSSEGSSLDSCSQSTTGGKSSASSQGREEETEMKLISRRQSHPYDRNIVPPPQDYSLFPAVASRNARNGTSEPMGPKESGNAESADSAGRHRNDVHGRGGGGGRRGGRGARKTGRSCSFSLTRTADEDETMSGIALGPMSHSYHAATTSAATATTIDSGVQTHGSYTASLRHKGRGVGTDRLRSGDDGDGGERGGEQRMVTKPMAKCDAAVQHSHRLLQEELRRSLPRATSSVSDNCSPPPSSSSSLPPSTFAAQPGQDVASSAKSSVFAPAQNSGRDQARVGGERQERTHGSEGCRGAPRDRVSAPPSGSRGDVHHPDTETGMWGGQGGSGLGNKAQLPRSQSVTSTFSVCSETGEVHVKKGSADTSVLQSDCQYPELGASQSSGTSPPPHPTGDHPTSLPNYTFPSSHASFVTSSAALQGGPSVQMSKNKMPTPTPTLASQPRRPVPSPPSQELRPAAVPSVHRSQSAKPKHKKIHLVPLEKSKTFKSKKEKGKGSKKGEADASHRRHDSSSRTNGCGAAPVGVNPAEQLAQPVRSHQPRLGVGDVLRGRVPVSAPSVKQYGFVDLGPPASVVPEAYIDSGRQLEGGGKEWHGDGGEGVHPTPVHLPLPHKSHSHGLTTQHHPSGHRGHATHGDKPHPTTRPKTKTRPLSSGLVVEPGRDPSDPAAALPHNSVARRRTKTLHLKKSRQSYPNPDGAVSGERKALCVDLGFVEPSPESGRTVCAGGDLGPYPVPPKRRALDRVCDKLPSGAEPCGLLEGRMSSYV